MVRKGAVDLLSDGGCWLGVEEAGPLKLVNPTLTLTLNLTPTLTLTLTLTLTRFAQAQRRTGRRAGR